MPNPRKSPFEEQAFRDSLKQFEKDEEKENIFLRAIVPEVLQKSLHTYEKQMTENEGKILKEQLDRIERKLDLIFGGHALVNGRWVSLKTMFRNIMLECIKK